MAALATKIKLYANREIDFRRDVRIIVDQNGINGSIVEWNLDIAKPTIEQLNSYEAQANIIENNEIQIQKRVKEYGSWQSQLDEIYHNGIDAWKQRITNIKNKYPKE